MRISSPYTVLPGHNGGENYLAEPKLFILTNWRFVIGGNEMINVSVAVDHTSKAGSLVGLLTNRIKSNFEEIEFEQSRIRFGNEFDLLDTHQTSIRTFVEF